MPRTTPPRRSPRRPALPTWHDLDQLMGNAQVVRHVMNLWPPFLAASIRIEEVSPDFRDVRVRLTRRPWSTNYVGTLYGASMYSMTDPFWMMMLQRTLGPEFAVWDTRGEIDHLRPGREDVTARFHLDEATLDEVRAATAGNAKHLRWFEVDLVQDDGTVVARVRKQVYVRRKPARS